MKKINFLAMVVLLVSFAVGVTSCIKSSNGNKNDDDDDVSTSASGTVTSTSITESDLLGTWAFVSSSDSSVDLKSITFNSDHSAVRVFGSGTEGGSWYLGDGVLYLTTTDEGKTSTATCTILSYTGSKITISSVEKYDGKTNTTLLTLKRS